MGRHTIVLLQRKAGDVKSRTYMHFNSTASAAMGVVQVYENLLKELNPGQASVHYELEQLYGWLDNLGDCSALMQRNNVSGGTESGGGGGGVRGEEGSEGREGSDAGRRRVQGGLGRVRSLLFSLRSLLRAQAARLGLS